MVEQTDPTAQQLAKQRVTVVGGTLNIILAITEFTVGWLNHSQALIADSIHTFSDLISDILVFFAAKHGSRGADADHPYGHARIETAVTVILGIILIAVGLSFIVDAGHRLLHPELLTQPGWPALSIVIVIIIVKELLYHYAIHVAKKIRSTMLKAAAWHYRSDSVSSIVVLIGVGGSIGGVAWLDVAAAATVGIMIIHVGWRFGWQALNELVDRGLEQEKIDQIKKLIYSVPGVNALHMLRTRRMGENVLVDVHLLVDPLVTVSEGHQISETVRVHLIRSMDEVMDVTVHIDPEDDEAFSPNNRLPLRKQILDALYHHWAEMAETQDIERINLHYLAGKIAVDVYLPYRGQKTADGGQGEMETLAKRLNDLAKAEPYVEKVTLYYRITPRL